MTNNEKLTESLPNTTNNIDFKEEEKNNILNFIKNLPNLLTVENLKKNYRVTPQGLFVDLNESKNLISIFAKNMNIPENKALKKLFSDESFPIYYLLEGKICLTGNLVPVEIKAPQQFKLPYYLGSLTDAKSYLHPQDPELQKLSDLTITGNKIQFQKGKYTYTINQEVLKRFNHFIEFSPMISKRFPNASKSLQQTLKAFIFFFKKANFVHNFKNFLVPEKSFGNKSYKFMEFNSLIFMFNKDNEIEDFYETKGKNLYYFMRKEFEKIKPSYRSEKTGTFKPFPANNRFLGTYTLNGKSSMLNPFAFFNFLETAPTMKSMEHYFNKVFTIEKTFEIFSYLYINAAPIEAKNIKSYIEKLNKYSSKYLINQQWLFGIDDKKNITTCIPKGNKK